MAKVRVLTSIARFPNQLRAGDELEVDDAQAQRWYDRKLAVPASVKPSKPKAKPEAPAAPPADTTPPKEPSGTPEDDTVDLKSSKPKAKGRGTK